MTVRELLDTNMGIVDVKITLRNKDGWLLNELNIGPDYGVVPPYPQRVPKEERYAGNYSEDTKKDAVYIRKNINTYDDGKEFFQLKLGVFPKGWLDLEVYSWHYSHVYPAHHTRKVPPGQFVFEGISITAQRYEDTLVVLEEPKALVQKSDQLEGQMHITEWLGGTE